MTKILVIEDEKSVRYNLVEMLIAEEFAAIGAPNGRVGVDLAKKEQPNLIICDIMMPQMDGYSVLIELREDPNTAKIPFIFLTAKADRSDLRLGMELGADDYLTKPFTRDELVAAIAIRLEKHAAMLQEYQTEQRRTQALQKQMQELRQILDTKEDLLQKLSQELRDPLSNINMAIHMLKNSPEGEARERYLQVLQQECAREIALLNQVSNLQNFLSPENARLLRKLNLINRKNNEENSSN
ncbi:ATP-binding response regulator [Phormidium sp. CCY1219]|uniref:ATP-binding response regulator n=1 Tax=Phormidium sp. CCY1219 TaxID=2886104 RepID=UPI002D1E9239|nr:response regulator [Phormidium sp. CCY1219]MEB3830174.1 response regulator [Phormidium sp. CCY1219]